MAVYEKRDLTIKINHFIINRGNTLVSLGRDVIAIRKSI